MSQERSPGANETSGTVTCPGCALTLPNRDGPTHAYIGANAACWATYGEVLAREFENPALFAEVHQLTVDAYAVQHPGVPERRSIQSVVLHLATLCLVLERGADQREGPRLHRYLVERPVWHWLEPPQPIGTLTVLDVLQADSPAQHATRVRAWAEDVWQAWAPHHATVCSWVEASGVYHRR